jgi:regulatory protein
MGLVDDLSFAQFWKDNRQSFSPRSRWLTGMELRRKGVANEIVEQVVSSVDDEESAYQAALTKAHSLAGLDAESFERRLGQYLKRRGFGYGVIKQSLERLRREQESPSTEISGKTR